MIVVRVYHIAHEGPDEEEVAEIWIENSKDLSFTRKGDTADYSVKYAVERGMAVGIHKRIIYGFPRKRYNVLALVLQALNTLSPKELKLEDDFDPDEAPVSTDLARRLRSALREIQGR